jgi:hypothetical protein
MTSQAINGHEKQPSKITEWVWFEGDTALKEGQGVCYNWDKGTAAEVDGRRSNRVELPSSTNARYFAGVAAREYRAVTGGQMIEICKPGSWCNILSKADCTIGVGRLTCEAGGSDAGYFIRAGFPGEGSAVPLQTIDRSSTAGKVFAKLEVGEPSGLVETLTVVDDDAITPMVGGVTYIIGAALGTGDCTATLADGTISGQRKAFSVVDTAVTTNNFVITVTSGLMGGIGAADGTGALSTITMNALKEEIVLEWAGVAADTQVWVPVTAVGATLA